MKKQYLAAAAVLVFYLACIAAALFGNGKNVYAKTAQTRQTEAGESTEETKQTKKDARPDYQALDYVTLGEYKGLKISEPTEEEILAWASSSDSVSEEETGETKETEALSDEERAEGRDILLKSQLLKKVLGNAAIIGYPQELLDYTVENLRSYYGGLAFVEGLTADEYISEYLGMDEEAFREQAESYAKEDLQQELILKAVAEAEGISLSEEEYEEGCLAYAESTGYYSVDRLVGVYGEGQIRISLLQEKVLDYLLEQAEIE